MSRRILAYTIAAAIAASASSASAALLNLPLRPDPEVIGSGIAFNDPGLLGFAFTASGGNSTLPAEATGLDITLVADLDGGGSLGLLGGALNVGNANGLFLGGVVSKTGFNIDAAGPDTLEFLLTGLTGSAAGEFGSRALARISGQFGASASEVFGQGFDAAASNISIRAVIPLPATLPLAVGGFALLLLAGRRRGGEPSAAWA